MRMSALQRRVARFATMATVVGLMVWGAGLARALAQAGGAAQAKPAAAKPAGAAAVARGKYLVDIAGCHDCHTPHKMGPDGPEPDMSLMLSGHPADMALPPPPPDERPLGVRRHRAVYRVGGSVGHQLHGEPHAGQGDGPRLVDRAAVCRHDPERAREQGRGRQILPPDAVAGVQAT